MECEISDCPLNKEDSFFQ